MIIYAETLERTGYTAAQLDKGGQLRIGAVFTDRGDGINIFRRSRAGSSLERRQ